MYKIIKNKNKHLKIINDLTTWDFSQRCVCGLKKKLAVSVDTWIEKDTLIYPNNIPYLNRDISDLRDYLYVIDCNVVLNEDNNVVCIVSYDMPVEAQGKLGCSLLSDRIKNYGNYLWIKRFKPSFSDIQELETQQTLNRLKKNMEFNLGIIPIRKDMDGFLTNQIERLTWLKDEIDNIDSIKPIYNKDEVLFVSQFDKPDSIGGVYEKTHRNIMTKGRDIADIFGLNYDKHYKRYNEHELLIPAKYQIDIPYPE